VYGIFTGFVRSLASGWKRAIRYFIAHIHQTLWHVEKTITLMKRQKPVELKLHYRTRTMSINN
jgi:hypothetical protein